MSQWSYAETGRVAEEHADGLRVSGRSKLRDDEKGMLLWIQQDVSLWSGQILFSPSNSISLPTNGIWIYFLWTCGCTSLLLNPLSIWEKCNITGVSSRSERCYRDSKILLTSHYEIYMIDLRDVGIKIRERVDRFGCQPIRGIGAVRFSDDRYRRPRRLRMQMLIAEFVLSHIMHRTASGSRRPAELPTDKTDRWKCMANNPVMRNASRNVDAYALLVQITRAIISAVTSRQFQTARNFCAWFSPTATVEVSLGNFISRESTVVR